jgi:hypothetical protein
MRYERGSGLAIEGPPSHIVCMYWPRCELGRHNDHHMNTKRECDEPLNVKPQAYAGQRQWPWWRLRIRSCSQSIESCLVIVFIHASQFAVCTDDRHANIHINKFLQPCAWCIKKRVNTCLYGIEHVQTIVEYSRTKPNCSSVLRVVVEKSGNMCLYFHQERRRHVRWVDRIRHD